MISLFTINHGGQCGLLSIKIDVTSRRGKAFNHHEVIQKCEEIRSVYPTIHWIYLYATLEDYNSDEDRNIALLIHMLTQNKFYVHGAFNPKNRLPAAYNCNYRSWHGEEDAYRDHAYIAVNEVIIEGDIFFIPTLPDSLAVSVPIIYPSKLYKKVREGVIGYKKHVIAFYTAPLIDDVIKGDD